MQNGLPALEALENFARNNDTVLAASLLELKQWYNNALIGKRQWDEIYLKSETIYQYLANKSSFQYKGILPEDMLIIKRYMNIFIQSLSTNYKSGKTKSRDEYMAENVDWLIKNSNGKKIILSADNTHVTKDSGKMGSFLSKWYGENYLVFGLTYNTGTYSAYGPDKYYEVHPSYPGTYEYLFSKARFENYILDLRSNIDIPLLNGFAGFRSIGSRPQETTQFEDINIREHFDVVVYMGHSTHTAPYFK
jgi:erythromycin esterase